MPQMRVFIVVCKVRVQLVAFQMHIRASILRALPRVLHRKIIDVHHARLLALLRQRHRPVKAVVADATDDLFLRHQLQHAFQIRLEPRLAGHWPRIAGLLVLVVIHQNDAVAVPRYMPQRLIVGPRLHVHVDPQILRAKIVVQLADPLRVQLLVFVRNQLEIEANPAVSGIRKQELVQLNVQPIPRCRIFQHLADHIAVPHLAQRVVIIQHRKDIGVFLRCLDRRLHAVLRIDTVHTGRVHHAVKLYREQRCRPDQVPVRRHHVQPVRKQQVNLVNMRFEDRVTGFVVLVERSAQTLILVQHYFRSMQRRLSTRRPSHGFLSELWLPLLQSLDVAFLRRQQQFG